jgi:hypothetical protein
MAQIFWQRGLCSDYIQARRQKSRSSSPGSVKNFHFSVSSRPAFGSTQLPFKWVQWALFTRVKLQGREAEHSPPISAEVKKPWTYTSTTPPRVFMAKS